MYQIWEHIILKISLDNGMDFWLQYDQPAQKKHLIKNKTEILKEPFGYSNVIVEKKSNNVAAHMKCINDKDWPFPVDENLSLKKLEINTGYGKDMEKYR